VNSLSAFSREHLERLDASMRAETLVQMRCLINRRLAELREWDAYWKEASLIRGELKALGHDLWRWDRDGEKSDLWGWNTRSSSKAGKLQIQFNFDDIVLIFWGDDEYVPSVVAVEDYSDRQ
jgi:hypothetical protein